MILLHLLILALASASAAASGTTTQPVTNLEDFKLDGRQQDDGSDTEWESAFNPSPCYGSQSHWLVPGCPTWLFNCTYEDSAYYFGTCMPSRFQSGCSSKCQSELASHEMTDECFNALQAMYPNMNTTLEKCGIYLPSSGMTGTRAAKTDRCIAALVAAFNRECVVTGLEVCPDSCKEEMKRQMGQGVSQQCYDIVANSVIRLLRQTAYPGFSRPEYDSYVTLCGLAVNANYTSDPNSKEGAEATEDATSGASVDRHSSSVSSLVAVLVGVVLVALVPMLL